MNLVELSKTLSHALRHAPEEYDLNLDDEGWVETNLLLKALGEKNPEWQSLEAKDLEHMISQSKKKRHELEGEYIRAIYGHSVDGKFRKDDQKPPEILYHGTSRKIAPVILKDGIKSMDRQYVHLSQVVKEAIRVGKRKDGEPVILKIDAEKAFHKGITFYQGNDRIWLSDYIPPDVISIYKKLKT